MRHAYTSVHDPMIMQQCFCSTIPPSLSNKYESAIVPLRNCSLTHSRYRSGTGRCCCI